MQGRLPFALILWLCACTTEGASSSGTTASSSGTADPGTDASSGTTTGSSGSDTQTSSGSSGTAGKECPAPEPGLENYVAYVEYDEADFSLGEPVLGVCDAVSFHPRERPGWWQGPHLSFICEVSSTEGPESVNVEVRLATDDLDAVLQSIEGKTRMQLRFGATTGVMGLSYSTEFSLRDEAGALILLQLTADLPSSQEPSEIELSPPDWLGDKTANESDWAAPFEYTAAKLDGCAPRPGAARRDNEVEVPWVIELRAGEATSVLYDRSTASMTTPEGPYSVFVESAVTSVTLVQDSTIGPTNLASVLIVRAL